MLDYFKRSTKITRVFILLCLCAVCIGVGARVFSYLQNHSFWLDETYVAYQITQQTFGEIFSGGFILKGQPVSPALFSAAAKIAALIFGNNELALRLIPFLFGMSALFLFYLFVKVYFPDKTFWLALALFAVSLPLIRYSAELKMYASDVWSAVLFLYLYEKGHRTGWPAKRMLGFGLLTGALMWLSYPIMFFLPGIFLVWILLVGNERKKEKIVSLISVIGAWGMSSVWLYILFFEKMVSNSLSVRIWENTPAFFSGGGICAGGIWALNRVFAMFTFFFSGGTAWLFFVLFIIGIWSTLKTDWRRAMIFFGPMICALGAAFLGKYPFHERFILFLMPMAIAVCLQGVACIMKILPSKFRESVLVFLAVVLLSGQVKAVVDHGFYGGVKEEGRDVLQYFKKAFKPGDLVILNNGAQFPFFYYMSSFHFDFTSFPKEARESGLNVESGFVSGFIPEGNINMKSRQGVLLEYFFIGDGHGRFLPRKASWHLFYIGKDIPFRFTDKKRVWVIFSHIGKNRRDVCLEAFNAHGRLLDRFQARGASLYLYDFSGRD